MADPHLKEAYHQSRLGQIFVRIEAASVEPLRAKQIRLLWCVARIFRMRDPSGLKAAVLNLATRDSWGIAA